MALEQHRFLQPQQPQAPRRKRWAGCLGGIPFFRKQKGGKRIVPASRTEANVLLNQPNGPQIGLSNPNTGIASLFAPPSSPASFSNSALHSTPQSPTMSANSPGGPPSTMFVTGPYAHETQLVSPPVFSTFTTEPSTAPFTPPPELAHLTTPSSPDVPYAHFLSSSAKIRSSEKTNYAFTDLQATYLLSPGSPASALRSPISRASGDCLSSSFNERELPQWDPSIPSKEPVYTNPDTSRFLGPQAAGTSKARKDTNFFCPETFAQFYDQSSFSNAGVRLSISKESDAYTNGGSGHQNRQNRTSKPDAEELDAYRASFDFSADEIVTTPNYVEISDVLDDSFRMTSFPSNKPVGEEQILALPKEGTETEKRHLNHTNGLHLGVLTSHELLEDLQIWLGDNDQGLHNHCILSDDGLFSKMGGSSRIGQKYQLGSSNSDAEVEYRRGRSLREGRRNRESDKMIWFDLLHKTVACMYI